MNHTILNLAQIRDRSYEVMDGDKPKIMPASFYRTTTMEERALIGARNALYNLPTIELVDWLKYEIRGRSAIEIGAAHGALAEALGIVATDNYLQAQPAIKSHYAAIGQKVIPYGERVERLDAEDAVRAFKPQVVVASWVTHKYDESRRSSGGNQFGVNEEAIIDACETYIFIENEEVHKGKSIWTRPHAKIRPDWLFSRSMSGKPEFIAIWNNPKRSVIYL